MSDAKLDKIFMRETLHLAKQGEGWTNPNPMVGAVIVKNGKMIARGYHHKAGMPHAEIEALRTAKTSVKGATLYVNLEPCCHYGKTPPCTEAIIKSGIKRVVFSTLDPNPKVAGKGAKALRKAGIKVSVGELAAAAKKLNEAFFTFHEKKRPFVGIHFAASLDGKIATRTFDSKWISNQQARKHSRRLRGEYQAILVGVNTVLRDDPHLGARTRGLKDPLRIILDTNLKIPLKSRVLRDTNVIIAVSTKASSKSILQLRKKGIKVLTFPGRKISIPQLLRKLYELNIISILAEGGGSVLGSFVDLRLVDKIYAFHAPLLIGGESAVSAIRGKGARSIAEAMRLQDISFQKLDDNLLTIGYPVKNS